ncbi:MAG TPA: sigma-70 family RNA polymerase sigma factor [Gemmatimonadales bacterium]|jgi:RNA polymerase sigma-70 factor (ECF subfamily)|nr:sigma-70 family RNA polymerase sigma factor [Gemmatimonadales bacterium]
MSVDMRLAASLATSPDDGLSTFLSARPRLFGTAVRMLGSATDAEDLLQDVWVRWQTADRSRVRSPIAFLLVATTRLAINVLHSARARREIPVDPVLREPVDPDDDPGLSAERGEALDEAMRLLLETLTPAERAAYVLRVAFNYRYGEIASILRIEDANARQLVARARAHVSGGRCEPASLAQRRRLRTAFVAAAGSGDLGGLERLLLQAPRTPRR